MKTVIGIPGLSKVGKILSKAEHVLALRKTLTGLEASKDEDSVKEVCNQLVGIGSELATYLLANQNKLTTKHTSENELVSCPVCGGEDLEAEDFVFEGNRITRIVSCEDEDCSHSWKEIFKFERSENIGEV